MKKYIIFFLCLFIFHLGTTLAQERQRYVKKTITVTSPKEGDGFKISETIQVSWKSEGITGNVKASLHKFQQSDIQTYNSNLPPTGSLTVPAGKIPPGRYFIRIQEINGTEINHGLLFTGVNELWNHNNLKCVSYYAAELYIKFRETF
jgi:hypothetical protein